VHADSHGDGHADDHADGHTDGHSDGHKESVGHKNAEGHSGGDDHSSDHVYVLEPPEGEIDINNLTYEQQEYLESIKLHFDYEIELSVYELDEAMVVALVSFCFPVQILFSYIFAKKTDRNFILRSANLLDGAIFICVLIWFEKFEEYIHDFKVDGFGLTDPPKQSHRFMHRMLNDIQSGDFHFDWLLAATAFLFWIRLLFMLQLTSTFGPLIRTIAAMLSDLSTFLVLLLIELAAFSCVGVLCFGMLTEYNNIVTTLIMFFQSSMGEWTYEIYDPLGDQMKYFGIMFHIVVVIANMILMLNLIIAIMSDTYAQLSDVKLGLYSQGIIEAIPVYKNDKRFGGLIVATPPLNLFTVLVSPLYFCWYKNKPDKLERFNMQFSRFIYFPVAVCITIGFSVCNLALLPVAFGKASIHKWILYRRTKQYAYFKEFAFFLTFGPYIMIINWLVEIWTFFRNLYKMTATKTSEALRYPKISLKAFNMFHFLVHKREGDFCNAKELVLETREAFKTNECIFGVLYANRSSMIDKRMALRK
jgi:hypothetical protein